MNALTSSTPLVINEDSQNYYIKKKITTFHMKYHMIFAEKKQSYFPQENDKDKTL